MIYKMKFAVILGVGTFLGSPANVFAENYVPLTTTLGDKSAYTLTELKEAPGADNKNVIIDYEVEKNGNLIEHYYEINIPEDIKTAYTVGEDPTIMTGQIPNITNGDDVNGVFAKLTSFAALKNANVGNINLDVISNTYPATSPIDTTNSTISSINGDFINNIGQNTVINLISSEVGSVHGNFIGNTVDRASDVVGTVIKNGFTTTQEIQNTQSISGNFINNSGISRNSYTEGGVLINIRNNNIGSIKGNFINNSAIAKKDATGGAILNHYSGNGVIGEIDGVFVKNHAVSDSMFAYAGAILNGQTINSLKGVFAENYVWSKGQITSRDEEWAKGGAIATSDIIAYPTMHHPYIGKIEADFFNNYAKSDYSYAKGGAIYHASGEIESIYNSNFIGNSVSGNEESAGGAIYAERDIHLTADNGVSLFKDNTVNGDSNAIYMQGNEDEDALDLDLTAVNNGIIQFDDAINGENYNINIKGDNSGEVFFNHNVENVNSLSLADNSVTHLGINGNIHANNMTAEGVASLKVDVDVDVENNKVSSGHIDVADDLSGNYSVIVNALNPSGLRDSKDMYVEFLSASQDNLETPADFTVSRVIGSPYKWTGATNIDPSDEGTHWYLQAADEKNVNPEVIAGIGLHEVAYEQTRSVLRNINHKIAAGKVYCPGCGIYTDSWDGKQLNNGWIIANNEESSIKKPVDVDGKLWGIDAGFDIQQDAHNVLGVFASYRKGNYDFSGKGNNYYSETGSEIDIKSYLAGIYYRYDKNMNWLFASAYAGKQKAEASTDDGIAQFDTDGTEFGARIEAGHSIALNNSLVLEPSISLSYTQINFDGARDNLGNDYSWQDLKVLEAETGLKVTKQFDNASIYVKPSVIHTWGLDDKFKTSELNSISTIKDQLLGRLELGGRYNLSNSFSGYAAVGYTLGESYNAYDLNVGISYNF